MSLDNILQNAAEDDMANKYLTFALGKEEFGIEICYVTEIVGMQKITAVPDFPDSFEGITNLRGRIIPIMNIRKCFKKEVVEYNDRTCIIILDINNVAFGVIVDMVSEVIEIPAENIAEPPKFSASASNRYVKGVAKTGDTIKLILDCKKILSEDQLNVLDELASAK